MAIKEMQDRIIWQWGFEHDATIWFFWYCEHNTDLTKISMAYEFAMEWEHEEE